MMLPPGRIWRLVFTNSCISLCIIINLHPSRWQSSTGWEVLSQLITKATHNCVSIYTNIYGVELLLRGQWQLYIQHTGNIRGRIWIDLDEIWTKCSWCTPTKWTDLKEKGLFEGFLIPTHPSHSRILQPNFPVAMSVDHLYLQQRAQSVDVALSFIKVRAHESEKKKISPLLLSQRKLIFLRKLKFNYCQVRAELDSFSTSSLTLSLLLWFCFLLGETESKDYKSRLAFPKVTFGTLVPWGRFGNKESVGKRISLENVAYYNIILETLGAIKRSKDP